MVHLVFEYYFNQLLAKVGKVVYAQMTIARSKFSHIRGCIMCNLNEDLMEYIFVRILIVGNFKVDMNYNMLPDFVCFACRGREHIAQYYPNKAKLNEAAHREKTDGDEAKSK